MKWVILATSVFLSSSLSAQRMDTSSLVYKTKPPGILIKKHRAIGNSLSAAGFLSLGFGILFGAKALHETTKDLIGLPVTLGDASSGKRQKIGGKADDYCKVAVGCLAAGIPLLVVGSVERRKVRLMLYSSQQYPALAFRPASNSLGLGLSFCLGK